MAYQLGGRRIEQTGQPQASGRHEGTVKWFNAEKGFGFILPAKGGGDVFVHAKAVKKAGLEPLVEGQRVSYELGTPKGGKAPPATNIQMA